LGVGKFEGKEMSHERNEQIKEQIAALDRIECTPGDRGRGRDIGMEAIEYGTKYGIDKILSSLGIEESPVKDLTHPNGYGSDFQLVAYYMILHQELKIMELQSRLDAIEGKG
jgi:hypothetical protein